MKYKSDIKLSQIKGLKEYRQDIKLEWQGYFRYYGLFFADYLNKKYDNVTMIKGLFLEYSSFNELKFNYYAKNYPYHKPSQAKDVFVKTIKDSKKRFVIIPISLMEHQNVLIYDTKLKQVELFDPYGENSINEFIKTSPEMDEYIKELFKEINEKIKFYKPVDFFPKNKEFQIYEIEVCPKKKFKINSLGFCVVWVFWYAEHRVKFPNKSRNELIKELLKLFDDDVKAILKSHEKKSNKVDMNLPICKVVRGYALFLTDLDKNLGYFSKLKLFIKSYKDIYR